MASDRLTVVRGDWNAIKDTLASVRTEGLFVPILFAAFRLAQWLAPSQWLRILAPGLLDKRRPEPFAALRPDASDALWIVRVLFVLLIPHLFSSTVGIVLACYVLAISIVQTINTSIFDQIRFGPLWVARSPQRMILRVCLELVTLIVAFGVLDYYGVKSGGIQANRPATLIDAIYFSATTALTIGYGDMYPLTWPWRMSASVEGLLVLLYGVLVVGRFASLLPIVGERMPADKAPAPGTSSPPGADSVDSGDAKAAGSGPPTWTARIAAGVAVAALVVSLMSLYFQSLRTKHELRAAVTFVNYKGRHLSGSIALYNTGNRIEIVSDARFIWGRSVGTGGGSLGPSFANPILLQPGSAVTIAISADTPPLGELRQLNELDDAKYLHVGVCISVVSSEAAPGGRVFIETISGITRFDLDASGEVVSSAPAAEDQRGMIYLFDGKPTD